MIKAFKYRVYPTKNQVGIIQRQLDLCRNLYNTGLEQRIIAYKSVGKRLSCPDQQKELPELKKEFPEFNDIYAQVLQQVLKRLDTSFQNFFRRVKRGEKPGFPRFQGKDRFDSICYPQNGFKIVGNRAELSKIGKLKIKLHRRIDGVVKTCIVKRSGTHWYVIFTAEQNTTVEKKPVSNAVGIDLGLETFAVLSDGSKIENHRYLKQSEQKLKETQSKYSKHKGKATKRKLSALHRKVVSQRNDFLHKQSRMIVDKYGLIAYEDLNIKKMAQNKFAKSIHDAGWGRFIEMIKYKAENAGVYAVAVNPRNTSKICSGCGTIVEKKISDRQHDCPVCNLSLHRDFNASLNILRLGTDLRNSVSKVVI